jgi:hypothetical protein
MDVQQWGCAHYKNDSLCFLVTLVLSFLTLKTSLKSKKIYLLALLSSTHLPFLSFKSIHMNVFFFVRLNNIPKRDVANVGPHGCAKFKKRSLFK